MGRTSTRSGSKDLPLMTHKPVAKSKSKSKSRMTPGRPMGSMVRSAAGRSLGSSSLRATSKRMRTSVPVAEAPRRFLSTNWVPRGRPPKSMTTSTRSAGEMRMLGVAKGRASRPPSEPIWMRSSPESSASSYSRLLEALMKRKRYLRVPTSK